MPKAVCVPRDGDRFICVYCNRQFNTMKLTKLHKKIKHGTNGIIKCIACDETFCDSRSHDIHYVKAYPLKGCKWNDKDKICSTYTP